MATVTLDLQPVLTLTQGQFAQLCQANPDAKLERTAQGELVIMAPTGGETGRVNFELNGQLWYWNKHHGFGKCFDSSTGFILPNGATRSPDMCWVEKSRWDSLTPAQQQKFVPLCPDFVAELLSPSDVVQQTRQKMQEYLDNGCRLGWLINQGDRQVEIYRPGQTVETLTTPKQLAGENILQDFVLDLSDLW
ncbi:Uma2 family endonuclease [Synechococcus moorigangaii CMS01]|nr:Uma2 family endonuclease [Synechococcus moorigangaii CMS01]